MSQLPDGVITFVFTDIQGSTKLWEDAADSMRTALEVHDGVIDSATQDHHGMSVKPRGEGDSRFLVFGSAIDAVNAVAEMQAGLSVAEWQTPSPILVRMAVHTGSADLKDGDYYGPAVNRAARLRALGHGGQTLLSRATWELIQDNLPAGTSISDLGLLRLKDLARPEHVYQLNVSGLPAEFPPLVSSGAVRNNLPRQLTDFVGRSEELEAVTEALQTSRLLTLLGPGGAGKTRLALRAAEALIGEFPDGVFFIDLASVKSPSEIVFAVAEALGVGMASSDDPESQLMTYLAPKRQLLVLDNFEHLLDGASLTARILTNSPDVRILATSRAKLNVTGETVLPILGLDTHWTELDEALHTSGVQLFTEGARRADASFTITDEDLEPLSEILRVVGGMPLGILLAAAWVDTLSVTEIAQEIAASLDFLESPASDVPDRHRSVRAAFDYSWTLLSAEEQELFAALSVFQGGFTRSAAQTVAEASVRALSNLANKSLVQADRESGRYSIHELLRQFAEAVLGDNQVRSDEIARSRTEFFAKRGADIEQRLPTDQLNALAEIEADLDNFRAAWRHALEDGNGTAARQLVIALWLLYEIRSWYQSGVALFGEALEAFGNGADEAGLVARNIAACQQAKFLTYIGDPEAAGLQVADAVAALAELSDTVAYVIGLEAQCDLLAFSGKIEDLRRVARMALGVAEEIGYEWFTAGLKTYVGMTEVFSGNIDGALPLLDEARATTERLGDYFMRTWNRMASGQLASMMGDHEGAVARYHEVIGLARALNYPRAVQFGLRSLGDSNYMAGDLAAANDTYLESLAMSEDLGLVHEMADMLAWVGRTNAALGSSELAVEILACVLRSPSAATPAIVEGPTATELAEQALDKLRDQLDEPTYAAAYARGEVKSVDLMAKELLAA